MRAGLGYKSGIVHPAAFGGVVRGSFKVVDYGECSLFLSLCIFAGVNGEGIFAIFAGFNMVMSAVIFGRYVAQFPYEYGVFNVFGVASYFLDWNAFLFVHPDGGRHGFLESEPGYGIPNLFTHNRVDDLFNVFFL